MAGKPEGKVESLCSSDTSAYNLHLNLEDGGDYVSPKLTSKYTAQQPTRPPFASISQKKP